MTEVSLTASSYLYKAIDTGFIGIQSRNVHVVYLGQLHSEG